jgi:hypothetical protein
MRILFSIMLVFALSGCAALSDGKPLEIFNKVIEKGKEVEGKTFDAAADTIDKYCDTVPEDARLYLRDGVNSRTKRGDITVNCE